MNFKNVFDKLSLSPNLISDLQMTRVNRINVKQDEKQMHIELYSKSLLDKNILMQLENELKIKFSMLDIFVNEKYEFDENENLELKLKKIWPNLLLDIGKQSRVCSEILNKSEWRLGDNDVINIDTKIGCSMFLKRKNIPIAIEKLIRDKLDTNLCVKLKDTLEYELKEQAPVIVPNEPKIKQEIKSKFKINNHLMPKNKLDEEFKINDNVCVSGTIFSIDVRKLKTENTLFIFGITDKKSSVTVKLFTHDETLTDVLKIGNGVIVKGKITLDGFSNELTLLANELCQCNCVIRQDNAKSKRIELHAHTQMSAMDATASANELIERAAYWGHKAIAITDHGVVQAYPDAMKAAKKFGVKVIYGMEAYLVNDLENIVQQAQSQTLDDTFVVFDLETTGLHKNHNKIIEIGAVKIKRGEIIDSFNTFVNPHEKINYKIQQLTSITDEMVENAPSIEEILPEFIKFIGSAVLVAHNADFDAGFISSAANSMGITLDNTVLDTLSLAKVLLPDLTRHGLSSLVKHLNINLFNHHRAEDDAHATAIMFMKFCDMLRERNITHIADINSLNKNSNNRIKSRAYHAIILVKNKTGLRNLYELVTKSHVNHFYKRPRILKSELVKRRDGLIIGSACEAGEVYSALRDNKSLSHMKDLVSFYDYLEVQPIDNNMFLVREEIFTREQLIELNKKIIAIGEELGKLVIATGDVHFLEPEDEIYRRVIMTCEGFKDAHHQPPLYMRTTNEMLDEFSYLTSEKANEIVITNPNLICEMVDEITPIPNGTYSPQIEGADDMLKTMTLNRAHEVYGETLPEIIETRLTRELDSLIKNKFAAMYIIAQKLVAKSMADGYLVGSRGSVGSSFVATMAGITEVNPLPAHYICSKCKYSEFHPTGGSGCDLPDKSCPICKTNLSKDGHDIPFETFLGFDGDKEPDIDLNFSGEYQLRAHAYAEELFGEGHVFKAGTIATIADKTAYGYVKKYFEHDNIKPRTSEINRLKLGCTGIKRTTGQHPGGLMIVPANHDIHEFCPVQYPANDSTTQVTTTHFDYHSISGRLLKLDLLGHDVPTILHMLEQITGVDIKTVPLADERVLSLFTSAKELGTACNTGTIGLPEFGTGFVRQMLIDTQPKTFSELVRISGLSHGTDVWFNNAHELIKSGHATLKTVIPTRDDIMIYLISCGVDNKQSFKIMENVRKGRGLTFDDAKLLKQHDVPNWYIESCNKIKYLFPKGHAVAYVMMTMRIGYFKIYYPIAFYAAVFSVRAEDFNYQTMCCGLDKVIQEINRLRGIEKQSAKDKSVLVLLELVKEFYERGLNFTKLDLYTADTTKFIVHDEKLMPPLCSIQGLGINVAQNIIETRQSGNFETIEEFRERTKANNTVIDLLKENHILDGIPETNQMSFI